MPFDGELYLRLFAERSGLAGAQSYRWGGSLLARARALVAVGAVAPQVAQRIVDDYGRADVLPGGVHVLRPRSGVHAASRQAAAADRRIGFCLRTIEQPWGRLQLRYAALDKGGTRLAVALLRNSVARSYSPGQPHGVGTLPASSWPPPLTVGDDRGTSIRMTFSGGGSNNKFRGNYNAGHALALDTRWITVLGERVELTESLPAVRVEIEILDSFRPAERFLRHCLEVRAEAHARRDSMEDAIEALVDCGMLPSDAPLIEQILATEAALQPRPGSPPPLNALSAWWRSLLIRRGFSDGPTGSIRIGTATPAFEGLRATLCTLESSGAGFQVDVALTGVTAMDPFSHAVATTSITYTANDDRGNSYLGQLGEWTRDNDVIDGQAEFWPGLDPQASRLDIALTADHSRALIQVPLDWMST